MYVFKSYVLKCKQTRPLVFLTKTKAQYAYMEHIRCNFILSLKTNVLEFLIVSFVFFYLFLFFFIYFLGLVIESRLLGVRVILGGLLGSYVGFLAGAFFSGVCFCGR